MVEALLHSIQCLLCFTGPGRVISRRQLPGTAGNLRRMLENRTLTLDSQDSQHLSATMVLNWKSLEAAHVTQVCETFLNSASPRLKPRGLIVVYKDKQLPAKTILRIAYCLANNIPSETKLKSASSEGSLQLLRSLGFRAERLQTNHPVADKS
jgi:hypothetical protein